DFDEMSAERTGESSATVRKRVVQAREQQSCRFGDAPDIYSNAGMDAQRVQEHCDLNEAGENLLRTASDRLGLSARGYTRILKVARTVADLEQSARIRPEHVSEAIQYRSLDRDWWQG
ncbi:MAG: magnesium chelatase, partial [Bacteroidetes bacterium QH_10_64_19]